MKSMIARSEEEPRRHQLTVNEYHRMGEVGLLAPYDRVELIEGEIIDMPPVGSVHATTVTLLATRLIRAIDDSAEARVQAPIRLGLRSEPEPDISLVRARPGSYRAHHPTARDVLLVIEVSDSTLRYDLGVKARLYAKHGVPEYWVFDLIDKKLHRHVQPSGGRYLEVDEAISGTVQLPLHDIRIGLEGVF